MSKVPFNMELGEVQQSFRDIWTALGPILEGKINLHGNALINSTSSSSFEIVYKAQSELATYQTTIGDSDADQLVWVTDYGHMLRWTGTAFVWGPGEDGANPILGFPAAPANAVATDVPGFWALCNGVTYHYLKQDGTLTTYATSNLTGHFLQLVVASPGTAVAVAPGISGTTASESNHTHNVDPPNTTSTANTPSVEVDANLIGTTVTVSGQHTHDTDISQFSSGAGNAHSHTVGTLAVDATGKPAAYKGLAYYRL